MSASEQYVCLECGRGYNYNKNSCALISNRTDFQPSVSFGNVGQLAMDILIRGTQAVKIGYVWHPAIFPVVGADPYEDSSLEIATSIELYCSENHKLVFVQIRAPVLKDLSSSFLNMLVQEIKQKRINHVIIITGAYDLERKDKEIQQHTVKCVVSPTLASREKIFQSSSGQEADALEDLKICDAASANLGFKIPGGGFAKYLYALCVKNEVPTAVFIQHCSEGYNIPDAFAVVQCLDKWLHVLPDSEEGTLMPSWRYAFGGAEKRDIF